MARSQQWYDDLSPSKRRRVMARMLAKAAFVGVVVLAGYYLLPMDSPGIRGTVILGVGLLVTAAVLTWRIWAIMNSPFPRLQAYEALLVGIPLLLSVFASGYYVLGETQVDSFTQSMSKIGAMYFTVTVFSTVGFGDITPTTDLARSLVTFQMIVGLVALGSAVRLLTRAVDVGLKRKSARLSHPEPDQEQSDPATG